MAVTLQTDEGLIRPLEGSTIRRYTAGGTITAGQPVAMLAAGTIAMADGNSSDPIADFVIGCALKSAAAGDRIDVVVHGPISNCTAATPGKLIYISDTEGLMDETSTSNGVVGWAESATVVFVRPEKA